MAAVDAEVLIQGEDRAGRGQLRQPHQASIRQRHWPVPAASCPADGQAVLARRTIWETAPIFGYWNEEGDCLVCGTSGWTLKDFDPWKWRAVKGVLPAWPVPHYVKAWSDVWHHPPADKEPVWLRRMGRITAAVPALWDLPTMGFYVGASDNPIPWQYVWRWKPRAVA